MFNTEMAFQLSNMEKVFLVPTWGFPYFKHGTDFPSFYYGKGFPSNQHGKGFPSFSDGKGHFSNTEKVFHLSTDPFFHYLCPTLVENLTDDAIA